jgi:streptogramin lyase
MRFSVFEDCNVLANLICNFRLLMSVAWCASIAAICHGDYPDFPQTQVVQEYEVDPAWPHRPERVKPLGAVSGIAVDKDDNVWVYNRGEDPVQVYTSEGEFVRTWGHDIIKEPHHLRIDPQGNVWVTDIGLHVVHQFTPEGELLKTLGVSGAQGEDEQHFYAPTDVAVSPSGDAFVSDGYGNRRIVHYDKDGNFVKAWGTFGTQPGQFTLPHSIVMNGAGKLYVADRNVGRIQVFDQQGKFLDQWDQVLMPWGLCATSSGDIWACGSTPYWWRRGGEAAPLKDQILVRFASNGRVKQTWSVPLGPEGHTQHGQCNGAHCIAQDSKGNLFVGDVFGNRAQKFVRSTDAPKGP